MDIQITVPEQVKTKQIKYINFVLEKNITIVEIWDENRQRVEVDLNGIMKGLTTTQQTTIRNFLSKIISVATGLDMVDIPDEILKEKVIK